MVRAAFAATAPGLAVHSFRKAPLCAVEAPSPTNRVQKFAESQGYVLENRSVGPLLNLELRVPETRSRLGYITGALLPNRLHIESYKASPRQGAGGLLMISPGMLLFIAALARASEAGLSNVYGLAIEDSPGQHRSLTRYLIRFGGEKVMRVTDELRYVPARMFYGGFGTVIRGDVEEMLERGLLMLQRASGR